MIFDFETDLKNEIVKEFARLEIKVSKHEKVRDYLFDYLTVQKKIISQLPREVIYSPILKAKLSSHPKKAEIEYLEKVMSNGQNVNFFQSRRLFEPNFHDHLAYEWNIHHFHLSFQPDKKGKFAKQVKQLLLVHISDERAIFLDTDNHIEGTFGDSKWQEILYDYFPEVLEPYFDPEIHDIFPNFNGKDLQTMWDKGYTIGMIKIRNKVYHNPGIGRSSSGHSIMVSRQVNEVFRWIWTIQDQLNKFLSPICYLAQIDPEKAAIKLRLDTKGINIFDFNSNKTLIEYPYTFDFPSQDENTDGLRNLP